MKKIIDKKIYNTETATLLASDRYWDGQNHDRHGRNTYLYRTPKGAFFACHITRWENEHDSIDVLSKNEAIDLYEHLPEQKLEFEEAFNIKPEEPTGRPQIYDQSMRQTALYMPDYMLEWLDNQPGSRSKTVRKIIEEKMNE